MSFKEHCDLCANRKSNLKDGLICGVTNNAPAFNRTCTKIRFSKEFIRRLGLIHINIERLNKKKTPIFICFLFAIIFGGFLVISQGYALIDYDFTPRRYRRASLPFLLILLGFGIISITYRKWNINRKKMKTAVEEKYIIDSILKKYQINYTCNVEFGEKYHGNQDVIIELKSNSNLLNDSKITYSI